MTAPEKPTPEQKLLESCRLLGVDSDASDRDVKRAFHLAARMLHPDVTGNDRLSNERFKLVVDAYNFLYERARNNKQRQTEELKNPQTLTQGRLFSRDWGAAPKPGPGPGPRAETAGLQLPADFPDRELILRIEASQNPLVRCEAVKILGRRRKRENAWILIKCLNDSSLIVRREAVRALGGAGCAVAVTALIKLWERDGRFLSYEIQRALELIGSPMAQRAVRRMSGPILNSRGQ